MSNATQTTPAAKASKAAKGFGLTCPFCGAADELNVDLNDLRKIACSGCGEDRSPQEMYARASELLARWSRVVAWLEVAPTE